jgi:two-component system, OmpR family, sensor histidine kinase KdpD
MAKSDTRDGRPDPDALLKRAEAERRTRGRLKVYLGAAPGVGKTFAMLASALRLKGEGVDVAVGLVETHGRAETAALLDGLDVLPRTPVTYRSRTLMEFDLDGALARKPKLLIVDELAHSNPPAGRHPKRYQDIEELLAAGIDVWTAVNIQHLESLSDVVSRITGVRVRETIPDTVLENADDVVVVDLTPSELIQRLKDGKVYLPENARRAIDRFFKPSNLTALRELALRRTADQVDDEMVSLLREQAIEGPWPASERLMVLVGGDADNDKVVREAARLATALKADWFAVNLRPPGATTQEAAVVARNDEAMRLAERLGAEAVRLEGNDRVGAILRYAKKENITQILCGRSARLGFARLFRRTLAGELIRRASDVSVHLITGPQVPKRFVWPKLPRSDDLTAGLVLALVSVGASVVAGSLLIRWLALPNLSMVFLTAVMLCAITYGRVSAIAAAVLSFLAYNFFFIEPIYTFTVAQPSELLALLMFLLVAVLTGGLAGRVREQSVATGQRAAATAALYDFSRKLSAAPTLYDVLWAASTQIASAAGGGSIILLPDGDTLAIRSGFPPEDTLGDAEWAAARRTWRFGDVTGWRSTTLPNAHYRFHPLRTPRGTIGVIGIQPPTLKEPLPIETERALAALIDQSAIAIERTLLVDETTKARHVAESERLRNALLSSLSHDLRTPLASILGSVTSLRTFRKELSEGERCDLLAAIEEEARRLSRFVSNLLDMTRLDSGAIEVKRDLVDVGDTVRSAAERSRKSFPSREIAITIEPGLLPVRGDSGLLEQMVFNLLDNANKYSPAGTPTAVHARRDGGAVVLTVRDQGDGIAREDLDRVFEKFYRGKQGDGRSAGTGLGLPICRGIVTAMGGTIEAESPVKDGHGTRIVVRLPAERAPTASENSS